LELYQVKEFYMAMVVPVLLYGSEENVYRKETWGSAEIKFQRSVKGCTMSDTTENAGI
jgi:hypothetical protein